MIRVNAGIKPYETSPNVAALHAAIRLLGQRLDPAELKKQLAGETTLRLVREFQKRAGISTPEDVLIDERTAEAINHLLEQQGLGGDSEGKSHTVTGTVTGPGGRPANALLVAVFDQDLRSRQELGRAKTDARGKYRVAYDPRQFARAEAGSADLVVVVMTAKGEVLHTTDVLFHAPRHAVVDVKLTDYRGESEFERIGRQVIPLLEGQNVGIEGLEENDETRDLTFIAAETGLPQDQLLKFAVAFRLRRRTELAAEPWYALQRTGALSPLFAQSDHPPTVTETEQSVFSRISSTPLQTIAAALERAVTAAFIPKPSEKELKQWLERYRALLVQGDQGGKTRELLKVAVGDGDKHGLLLDLYLQAGGARHTVLDLARKTEKFNAKELDAIDATLRLDDLTFGDTQLVGHLRKKGADPGAVRKLARNRVEEWRKTLDDAGAIPDFIKGDDREKKAENYARLLTKQFQREYPTEAFAGDLERDIREGRPALREAPAILEFLDQNPAFDLRSISVDAYLKKEGRQFLKGRNEQERTSFTTALKSAQRVYKVAPNYEATNTLLADGIHSAHQIYRTGKSKFKARYKNARGFDDKSAETTWESAANTYGALVTLLGDLQATYDAGNVGALAVEIDDFPNIANLFGNADMCECEECRSIFSPAAYFADVLMFLDNRASLVAGKSVKDILLERRPDLAYIELTCENSHTPLPYIDLAAEVLEDRVSPWKIVDLPITAALTASLNARDAAAVRAAFAAAVPPLAISAAATVSEKNVDLGSWIVRDGELSFVVATTGAGYRVSATRQTRGTAEELAAAPEYVNGPAYAALSIPTYPMALPFNLNTEEVRAVLDKGGIQRADLMETFRGPNAPNNPSDLAIAREAAGIGDYETTAVFGDNAADEFRFWGEADNPATVASLTRVDVFLNRTGLEYDELQKLLTMQFVNPDPPTLSIRHLDSSCDTAQKRLQVLTPDALNRIHRFLRLWRKLGWNMWEVDLVITRLGGGALGDQLAANLRPFLKLLKRFPSLSVEQLSAFWGDLNTRSKFTAAFKKPEPSLYEKLFLNKRISNPVDDAFALAAVTNAATLVTLDAHLAPVFAAMRISQADLAALRALTQPGGNAAAINDKLRLDNLSFLYRHATLARQLRIKIADWAKLIFLLQRDVFQTPAKTWELVETVDRIAASGLSIDQLDYILTANLSAKSAESERNVTSALTTLRKALQGIAADNDPAKLPTAVDDLAALLTAKLQVAGWSAGAAESVVDAITNRSRLRVVVPTIPAGFALPAAIQAAVPSLSYDDASQAFNFTGFMTDAERNTLLNHATLAAITGDANYQNAVEQIHSAPRLLIKFYDPSFTAPLPALPAAVDFTALPPDLAAKVAYDTEAKTLTFFGAMTADEKTALDALSADAAYRAAVLALFNRPRGVGFPPEQIWMLPGDLQFPLVDEDDPLADKRPANLGEAATRLLAYLKRTLSREEVVQQFATALRIAPAIAERLLTTFTLFGGRPLLEEYTDPAFVSSSAALSRATDQEKFDGYYWMHRVALVLRTFKVALPELDWMLRTHAQTDVLDLDTLPIVLAVPPAVPDVAPIDRLLDLADFMKFHHDHSEDDLSMLAVAERLITDPGYTAPMFGADVERLTEWPAADVATLAGALDIAFPAGYAKIGAWRRLTRAFLMLRRLNASAAAFLPLAGAAVGENEAKAAKQMLRSKYDEKEWLDLSKSIQDVLRERKRASLVAYLLTLPQPADAPTNKWDNSNDLFAYYLIDVEMGACQPSSRIVQASAAAQLFVQRCLMGLEPKVHVSIEEDDDWSQWKWMKNYRVWEANRRVFAYPENYALPELRRDKSEIFKNLEDELQQNDVNRDTVETAFIHYVERLDDVAQLEIAGTYYQESTRTLHVFGRTAGSEPHIYYYRQFIDGRRWTAWSKVECDIKSDYLVPLVTNERLHLVWPEFRERPKGPDQATVPDSTAPGPVDIDKPVKDIDVYLAVSELRSGKWTPKKVSQEPMAAESGVTDDFDKSGYAIYPIDLTWLYPSAPFLLLVYGNNGSTSELFELAGCRGYPEPFRPDFGGEAVNFAPSLTRFDRDALLFMKNAEQESEGDGALVPLNDAFMLATILGNTPGLFKISYPNYMSRFDRLRFLFTLVIAAWVEGSIGRVGMKRQRYRLPITLGSFYDWFYADKLHTFFVRPEVTSSVLGKTLFYQDLIEIVEELFTLFFSGKWEELFKKQQSLWGADYRFRLLFKTFYHPLTCLFAKELYAHGVEALMARKTQFADKHLDFESVNVYAPTDVVDTNYPKEIVDFEPDGAYSIYNWELFFHAPLMIAMRLSAEQRFEESMRWFHFIFDPTGASAKDPITAAPSPAPQKYWITQPFYKRQTSEYTSQRIEKLMGLMAGDPHALTGVGQELSKQVMDWRRSPFDPHLIANFRQVAYQKLTVMKYIDNLIAWGDERFRMDTMESVNEATQIYVVAAEILGQRPRKVPPAAKPKPETFSELQEKFDAFSNALIEMENLVPPMPSGSGSGMPAPSIPAMLYFCIPPNDQMLKYWDVVADRLYKIRHCLNIEGVARQLALFAPPIDPMALVKAAAAGIDIGSAIADLDAPLPHYKFGTMLQKANELAGDLRALAASLLAALEKKDAEQLARIRQGHEIALLQAVRNIKQQMIDDAKLVVDGLRKNKELITIRRDYYASREFMNAGEITAMTLSAASLISHTAGTIADILAGVMFLIPDFKVGASGFGGSPHFAVEPPIGTKLGQSATRGGNGLYNLATILDKSASIAATVGGYQRRSDDWENNVNLANKELEQIDRQIASAEVKVAVAEKELENHDLQISNSKAVETFMHDKYTNQELYQWMVTQISQTYFQTYKLAYDIAKRAERCYRYEVGVEDSSYIQYGYWDSMKSGLMAGERLQLDLRRLDNAFHDQNRRELECTKHISLAMLDPRALLALKENGLCTVDLPEELFDFDYPGHYFRRIKSVSLSIPCVAGPHTTVTCTLRLLRNRVRTNTSLVPQYEHNNDDGVLTDDPRFAESHVRVKAIATSSGQNDSGLFEMSFRDERYLPFEGAGAVSTWQIELTQARELRQFSYDTISDVILHMRYTAREDAGAFKQNAVDHMKSVIDAAAGRMPLRRLFDLKREFPTEWYAFLHPTGGGDKTLQVNVRQRHFPYFAQERDIQIESIALVVRSDSTDAMVATIDPPIPEAGLPPAPDPIALLATADPDGRRRFHIGTKADLGVLLDETQPWRLRLRKDPGNFNGITDEQLEEAYVIVEYTAV